MSTDADSRMNREGFGSSGASLGTVTFDPLGSDRRSRFVDAWPDFLADGAWRSHSSGSREGAVTRPFPGLTLVDLETESTDAVIRLIAQPFLAAAALIT